jgi:hypothetical protein
MKTDWTKEPIGRWTHRHVWGSPNPEKVYHFARTFVIKKILRDRAIRRPGAPGLRVTPFGLTGPFGWLHNVTKHSKISLTVNPSSFLLRGHPKVFAAMLVAPSVGYIELDTKDVPEIRSTTYTNSPKLLGFSSRYGTAPPHVEPCWFQYEEEWFTTADRIPLTPGRFRAVERFRPGDVHWPTDRGTGGQTR